MPPKRKRTAKERTGTMKKRKLFSQAGDRLPYTANLGAGPIPAKAIVKLRYVQSNTANGTTIESGRFNLNSIFDPDSLGAGHQPLGRDQYANFYNRYRVLWVDVTIRGVVEQSSSTNGVRIHIIPNNDTTTFTDADLAAEQKECSTYVITAGGKPLYHSKRYYLWNIVGVTKQVYMADDRFQAEFSTSPAEAIILHCVNSEIDTTANDANGYRYIVRLDMTCELFDRVALSSS